MWPQIKVIAFDADDTLWVNEPYFRAAEEQFCSLLEDFLPHHSAHKALFQTEINNLEHYGYGIKGFMLSMIETALSVSNGKVDSGVIEQALQIGKKMLHQPIELLPHISETLQQLKSHYKLVVATKGDLLDQERKLKKSGLAHFFHHIEVMSDKQVSDYQSLLQHLDISPSELLMVGNSLKSDIVPVVELGGYAIHIPFHTTWQHEHIDHHFTSERYRELADVSLLPRLLLGQEAG